MKTKPDLGFWKLWNLSFGFFGVQIAYALQSANVSRIFATLGADPHDLSYFWILPPLMGMIVQPIVGTASDRTWTRLGRRLPYLIIGAAVAVLVMCLLPNAGSFGLAVSSAIILGLVALMLLDTSINMAMQPFKMLVGDMVNEKQKGLAYSIQSFLCNAGSIVGYVFPFLLTWIGFRNTAAAGVIPQTVVFSFYAGAAILLGCVLYTLAKVKEWPPVLYQEYNGGDPEPTKEGEKAKRPGLLKLLGNAPSTFWTVGLVQFFCWFAFLFMWTYTNGTIAKNAFDCPEATTINAIQQLDAQGKVVDSYSAKFILDADSNLVVAQGKAAAAGITLADGTFVQAKSVTLLTTDRDSVTIGSGIAAITVPTKGIPMPTDVYTDGNLNYVNGIARYNFNKPIDTKDAVIVIDGDKQIKSADITINDRLSRLQPNSKLILADIYSHDPATGDLYVDSNDEVTLADPARADYKSSVVLNTESKEYNDAGNWVGILFAIQAIGSVLWAVVLPMFRSRKFSYSLSLLIGAVGFISAGYFTNQYMLFISFTLIGCAWAAMLAWPFTILTNSLRHGNIGAYLGLFNCSICVPQIIGALLGGVILSAIGAPDQLAPQYMMMVIAGISLILGAVSVIFIREYKSDDNPAAKPE